MVLLAAYTPVRVQEGKRQYRQSFTNTNNHDENANPCLSYPASVNLASITCSSKKGFTDTNPDERTQSPLLSYPATSNLANNTRITGAVVTTVVDPAAINEQRSGCGDHRSFK